MKIQLLCTIVYALLFSACGNNSNRSNYKFGQKNALWVESDFLRGYHSATNTPFTEEDMVNYVNTIKKNKIKYVYMYAGPFQKDGHLSSFGFSHAAKAAITFTKKECPDLMMLLWIGGVQNKMVFLEDSDWMKNALNDTGELVKGLNIGGVHVDFEYYLPGETYLDTMVSANNSASSEVFSQNVFHFHQKLRSLMPSAFISAGVVGTAPGIKSWRKKPSLAELMNLTPFIDQFSFQFYDTQISSQKEFDKNCQKLIADIQFLKNRSPIEYLIAINTTTNPDPLKKFSDPKIENIPNTLGTIRTQLNRLESRLITGIAVFSNWGTDSEEWHQFGEHWVNPN